MKNIKIIFLIIVNTGILFILVNLIIFFFNNKIIIEKYFNRSYLSKLPVSYLVYYFNTNDKSFKNYTAIMGDSHVVGAGTSDPKFNNYTIGYFLKKLNPNKNYITFGWPGGGSISILKLFEMSRDSLVYGRIKEDPKKIIYIFNESNDLTDDYNHKYLNITDYAFTKKEYIKQLLPVLYFIYLTFHNRDYKYSKEIKNTILFKDKKIDITNKGRLDIPEISGDRLNKAYNILYDNLNKIKKRTDVIYFVFLPSPATLYEFKDPLQSISYSNKSAIKITKRDHEIYHQEVKKKLQILCKKLDIKFIDLTHEMKIMSKVTLINGPEDFGHYNVQGNEFIAKIINSKLN